MEWVKLYTTFHDHRKTVELTCTEIGLWTLCLSWSGAQETDGFIPRRIALRFLGGEDGDLVIGRLVKAGYWDVVEGGYQMRAWDERQQTKVERDAIREKRSAAGRLGGRPRKHPETNLLINEKAEESREEKSRQETLPPTPLITDQCVVLDSVELGGSRRAWLPTPGEDDNFAEVFVEAYQQSHGGQKPPGTCMAEIVSAARLCQHGGTPVRDLREAVARCARSNATKEWEFNKTLMAVQGGGAPERPASKNPIDAQIESLLRRAGGHRT